MLISADLNPDGGDVKKRTYIGVAKLLSVRGLDTHHYIKHRRN